jgi:hypothetical protein
MQLRQPRTAVFAAILVACVFPCAADAAKHPDLTVRGASVLTPSVAQKGQVRVSAVVRNAGKTAAPASKVGLYLSTDKRRSKSDKRLATAKVKRLGKGARGTAKGKGKLAGSVKPGAYFVIACADDGSRAKESNERNNCRAAKGKLGVTAAAKPVAVSPQLEAGRAFDSPVQADLGGTAFTGSTDGTSYTLIVPGGALTHDARITMTPLTGIAGLPLSGGLVAGVQIDDDALQFAKPALLVIQREGLAPGPSQVAFGYHNSGTDFFLSPFGQRPPGYPSEAIVVPILHGGGYGVANATAADVAAQRAKTPARAEDQLAQEAATLGGAAKRGVRMKATEFNDAAFVAKAHEVYAQKIQPQMTAAETNDAVLSQAASDAFGWMREVTLVGHDEEFQAEFQQIYKSLEKALDNAYEQAKKKCKAGDYKQVARLTQIERFRQLLGIGSEKSNLAEDVDKCLSFELRVKSHIEVHENPGGGDHVDEVSELVSTVPLHLDLNNGRLSGDAPFEYRLFTDDSRVTIAGQDCQITSTVRETGRLVNGQLNIFSANVSAGDPGAPPSAPEVTMIVDPGQPAEETHTDTSGCGTSDSRDQLENVWLFEWTTFFHNGDAFDSGGSSGPWLIDKFTPGAKPTVGTRTFTMVVGARSITETWELVHTPKL